MSHLGYNKSTLEPAKLENITTYGNIITHDNNAGALAYNAVSVNIIDCNNYTNITSQSGKISAFLGQIYHGEKVSFNNCNNYGSIINAGITNDNTSSMLIANEVTTQNFNVNIENCKNYGLIISAVKENSNLITKDYRHIDKDIKNDTSKDGNKGLCTVVGTIKELKLTDGSYVFDTLSVASSYKLSFSYTYKYGEKGHGTSAYVANVNPSDKVNAYEWINYTEGMKLTEVNVGDITLQTTTVDGTTYYVFDHKIGGSRCTTTSITIQYVAYNASEIPIAVYTTTVNCK